MSILALLALALVLGMASEEDGAGCLMMLAIVVGLAMLTGGM